MNPVENVWQFLRANWLAISVFDDCPAIVDACCPAWNRFADDPKTATSITDRQWAQVNLQGRWYDSLQTPIRLGFPLDYRERLFPNIFADSPV